MIRKIRFKSRRRLPLAVSWQPWGLGLRECHECSSCTIPADARVANIMVPCARQSLFVHYDLGAMVVFCSAIHKLVFICKIPDGGCIH